jgi:Flp pilus assembly protein TadG
MPMLKRPIAFLKDTSGNTLLEAAMVTPLLLVLTFGLVDFATMFYVHLSMETGISQATRFAVTGATKNDPDNPSIPLSREGTIRAAMQEAAPTLDIDAMTFNFTHMKPGHTTWSSGAGGAGDIGRVSVEYDWEPLTPIVRPLLTDGKLRVRVESSMKHESKWE